MATVVRRLNGDVPPDHGFRIRTERLLLRPLGHADLAEFSRYRNDPVVARFQEWPLPYTVELAGALIDETLRLQRPTPGEWVQLGIERHGRLVGDVAVWIDPAEESAMIGYTVSVEHQGRGYAVEAADGVVGWIFEHTGVHRVAAELDDANHASARVLERCGFEHAGTTRRAVLSRGVWTDDTRYSLLRDTWRAWKARPTAAPKAVSLVEVTAANVRAVGALRTGTSQERFVSPVLDSIADAAHPPRRDGVAERPWYRAVDADDELAAFVMLALPTTARPVPVLWRLIVDLRHQGRGIGRRTVGLAAAHLATLGCDDVEVSYVAGPGGPAGFYRRLGFEPTGLIEDGETWARASLERLLADAHEGD